MTKSSTQLSGVLNIDKPAGITSHDVVAHIRRLTGIRQIGHAGTLDPFATGVLLVAIGSATRLLEYTRPLSKTYEAEITLGATSDTDDVTGVITSRTGKTPGVSKKTPGVKEVRDTLARFTGPIQQIPPAYAAIKIKGRKLYEYARAGERVQPKPRPVTIHSIKLLQYQYPTMNIRVVCSTGTYIRALARDIGIALKTGAYCSQLRRTAIGPFEIAKSISIEKLSTGLRSASADEGLCPAKPWRSGATTHQIAAELRPAGSFLQYLLPIESLVSHLPPYTLPTGNVAKFQQGQRIALPEAQPRSEAAASTTGASRPFAIFDSEKNLLGIGYVDTQNSLLSPNKVL